MKNSIKKVTLLLLVVLVLAASFGCTPKEESQKKFYTNLGFLDEKSTEDNKNYITIGANGENIKLEVKDDDIFNGLEEKQYYIVGYDEDNILKSIDVNEFIKDLVVNSMTETPTTGDTFTISSSEPGKFDDLTLLDSSKIDYNNDGSEETISLYTVAGKGPDGQIAWDDGQNWTLVIQGSDKDYVLFDDYIQLGSLHFYAYFEDEDFVVTTVQSGTANLKLTEYRFDKEKDEFIGTVRFVTTGNVNMIHQAPLKY
ncbi:hypothetical protein RBU61_19400 [Tissierella sp. MB52-C2]|uniref:hypothetical protein n=1 Tax=Tissierella sp. MB52-C2 TaxID=3070999 RepID=UPI00280B3C5D|nr:hypothetical protein [Tissierella sp. MB52-C2]WMM25068.1 hypothetical protein RBU61_19400 [Tissierella sp. MB52-C2]